MNKYQGEIEQRGPRTAVDHDEEKTERRGGGGRDSVPPSMKPAQSHPGVLHLLAILLIGDEARQRGVAAGRRGIRRITREQPGFSSVPRR